MKKYYFDEISTSPELSFVLLTSMPKISESQIKTAKKIYNRGVDCDKVCNLVKNHRVYSIVYENLKLLNLSNNKEFTAIKQWAAKASYNFLNQTKELISIIKEFDKLGIKMLLIKGFSLGKKLYKEPSHRVSKDIDILVSENQVMEAFKALGTLGYTSEFNKMLSQNSCKSLLKRQNHFEFNKGLIVSIELHWILNYYLQLESVWDTCNKINYYGTDLYVLPDIEEQLYAMGHGLRHGFYRIKWILDIVEFIKQDKIDWDELFKLAKERSETYVVLASLFLCFSVFEFGLSSGKYGNIYLRRENNKIIIYVEENDMFLQKEIECAINFIPNLQFNIKSEKDPVEAKLDKKPLKTFIKEYKKRKKVRGYNLNKFAPNRVDIKRFSFSDKWFFMYYIVRPPYKVYRMIKNKFKK